MKLNSTNFNNDWNNKTLSELGTFARGKSRHRPRNDPALYAGGCHPLIQTGDITQATFRITSHSAAYNDMGLAQSKLWPAGTLCITIAANIAETAILGYPMCFPDSVVGFSADPDETSEVFMHYVFTYIRKAIQNSVTGSIQDNINIEYLTNLRFKIPSPDEQDRIASVLSALDAKIDLNNRINAELETSAKTIYDYWFVQFDFPDANSRPYRSSGGAMVWNDTLKREIPAGWSDDLLGNIVDVLDSRRIPLSKQQRESRPGIIPYYGATGAMGYVDDFLFDEELLLLAEDGSVVDERGKVVLQRIWGKSWVNNHAHVLRPRNGWTVELLYLMLREVPAVQMMSGSIQKKITQEKLSAKRILLAPDPLRISLTNILLPLRERQKLATEESAELTQLRDWLLPLLMNGQVRLA